MNGMQTFDSSDGTRIRTVLIDGEPWFIAVDLAAALGYRDAANATRTLREAEKGTHVASTGGGGQEHTIISEAGFYRLVMRSNRPEAERFQAWVTSEVLPQIRRTGRYTPGGRGGGELELPGTYSDALRAAADQYDRAEVERLARIAAEKTVKELKPAADAWTNLGSGGGDMSVSDAAKILSRDTGIEIGERRLFTLLRELEWIYRDRRDGKYRPHQSDIAGGRLLAGIQSHVSTVTGRTVLDPPQVRVTPAGVAELRTHIESATREECAAAAG